MHKVYKYRPLSPFLYKELFYQEIYFASYTELNDPFDLNVTIEFNISDVKQVGTLTLPLFHSTVVIRKDITDTERINNTKLALFTRNNEKVRKFNQLVYEYLLQLKGDHPFIYADMAIEALRLAVAKSKLDFTLDTSKLFEKIGRLTKMFLTNSYVSCFSTDPKSFLMWSHYAGSHQGICLEFSLPNDGKFPFEMAGRREFIKGSVEQGFAEGKIGIYIYEENMFRVRYSDEPLHVNYFDFAPVFLNEHDIDLRNLTKSRWHGYARHLQNLFLTKTPAWAYENELRMVEVNFAGAKEPEDRLRHYPIETLTAIYFGCNISDVTKRRIARIYREKHHDITFMNCKLSNDRQLTVEPWEFYEDDEL